MSQIDRDTLQDQEINGLKEQVAELRKRVDLFLSLVDPEDVRAAIRMEQTKQELTHEMLLDLAATSQAPADLFDVD